jgi:N-acetylmuramoyl-L-alanine amidase
VGRPARVAGVFSNESHGGGRYGLAVVAAVVTAAVCLGGCGSEGPSSGPGSDSGSASGDGKPGASNASSASPGATRSASSAPSADASAETLPLAGKVVVLDPGHNPTNYQHTKEINQLVGIGTNRKECDTTGTETNAGYPEASYTLDVSRRVRAILVTRGAKVVLTQNGDLPYGPCVDQRAEIGNRAHADAALSIHADGAPASAHGFHVIAPKSLHAGAADTRAIAAPSLRLATTLRADFKAATGEPFANYLGDGKGLMVRSDLGGLNLSTVPKVFIECGNMRNAQDAKSLTASSWRQRAAQGIADGLTAFLRSSPADSGNGKR